MRRLLSLLLLAAFSLPLIAPALALGQDLDSNLPLCCRRHGAHHCAMNLGRPQNAPAFSQRCPSFPQPTTIAPSGSFAALITVASLDSAHSFSLTPTQRAETQLRIARQRSRHKRGPPQQLL